MIVLLLAVLGLRMDLRIADRRQRLLLDAQVTRVRRIQLQRVGQRAGLNGQDVVQFGLREKDGQKECDWPISSIA